MVRILRETDIRSNDDGGDSSDDDGGYSSDDDGGDISNDDDGDLSVGQGLSGRGFRVYIHVHTPTY